MLDAVTQLGNHRGALTGHCHRMPGSPARAARWLLALWALVPVPAAAHELGPFQVYGTFLRSGAFLLEIRVDEEHLAAAQLGGPGRPTRYGRIAGLDGPVERRFGRFLSGLADSMTVSFDGIAVKPALAMEPPEGGGAAANGAPARATLRVEGWIPGGAGSFTFASSLPVKLYPLVLHCEEDESSTWRWVAGKETSPAFALAPRVVPPARAAVLGRGLALGFDRVLPHGPAPLLLVAALFLAARRLRVALVALAALVLGQGLGLVLALRGTLPAMRSSLLAALAALAIAGVAAAGLGALPRWQAQWPWRAWRHPRPRSGPPGGAPPPSWPTLALGLLAVLGIGGLFGAWLAPELPGGIAAAAAPGTAAPLTPPLLLGAAAGCALGAGAAELLAMAAAFVLVGLPFGDEAWYRARVVVPVCSLIAVVSLYWSLSGLLS